VVIYHHNDADGQAAAAVVLYALELDLLADGDGVTLHELDYKDGDAVNFALDVAEDEHVVIVDVSFKPPKFKELMQRTKYVTWCDHHRTTENYDYAREDVPHVYGQRIDGLRDFATHGRCGAELAWEYFMQGIRVPPALALLGDYDAWRMMDPLMCLPFYEGLKLQDTNPEGTLWRVLMTESPDGERLGERAKGIIEHGHTAIKYRDAYCEKMRSNFGNMVKWEGLNCYACNIFMFGSKGFGELMDLFDVCISYVRNDKTGQWNVSLYSQKKDVGVIAKEYGGGGHAGAAGFTCDRLPWVPGIVGGTDAVLTTMVHMAAGMLSGLPQYSDRHPMDVLAELRSMAMKELEREKGNR
jgi:oligoribonuclease NrnB/cAMP/cGMP phosphodiesterase (DHH superfamily)